LAAEGWTLDEKYCWTLVYIVVLKRTDGTTPKLVKTYGGRFFFSEEEATEFFDNLEPNIRACFGVRGIFIFMWTHA